MNSPFASNPYLSIALPFVTDCQICDRQLAIAQRAERKLQRCLSLNEIGLDIDMRWSIRFMPREQKRFIHADFQANCCN